MSSYRQPQLIYSSSNDGPPLRPLPNAAPRIDDLYRRPPPLAQPTTRAPTFATEAVASPRFEAQPSISPYSHLLARNRPAQQERSDLLDRILPHPNDPRRSSTSQSATPRSQHPLQQQSQQQQGGGRSSFLYTPPAGYSPTLTAQDAPPRSQRAPLIYKAPPGLSMPPRQLLAPRPNDYDETEQPTMKKSRPEVVPRRGEGSSFGGLMYTKALPLPSDYPVRAPPPLAEIHSPPKVPFATVARPPIVTTRSNNAPQQQAAPKVVPTILTKVVVDTCVFLNFSEHDLDLLRRKRTIQVCIPLTVLNELDGHNKSNSADRSHAARRARDWIISEQTHVRIEKRSECEFLSRQTNDDKILGFGCLLLREEKERVEKEVEKQRQLAREEEQRFGRSYRKVEEVPPVKIYMCTNDNMLSLKASNEGMLTCDHHGIFRL